MELVLDRLVEWVYTLSPLSIYSVFFLVAYMENILPPIPGDLFVVFGGYLAAAGVLSFTTLLMLTTIASITGFMSMYGIGSYWGFRIDTDESDFWLARVVDVSYFEKGKRWMQRWGQWVIVVNRFLAGARPVIALTAGIYRTKLNYTLLSVTISSLLWNVILIGLGWLVKENWQVIGRYLEIYGWTILGLIVLFVTLRFAYVLIWRRRWGLW